MRLISLSFFLLLLINSSFSPHSTPWNFDEQLDHYLQAHTKRIQQKTIEELEDIQDWSTYQKEARTQLYEMLGMNPVLPKTDLNPVVTGAVEHEEFRVENLHFQSLPGLYVTANLYIPKEIKQPLPAILYVCGHANVVENGISYGSKVNYQHHPAWFARNGYVCLIIDTFQLGEIEGIHHGTYRYDRWWWLSRGYTPAGVEAWNSIRALDYLTTRKEVDASRLGITGRSGGGVYSWWAAALDDRIKVAVPVAGITDMENHVIDGCVEGHCDCMYLVNSYEWDYPKVAALVAPRPLLISNTDRDPIFPLNGVYRTFESTAKVYQQLNARQDIALHTTAGPHKDTQELRVHAFRWFNHYLRDTDELIETAAVKYFSPQELKVFDTLPQHQINTNVDEYFVPKAKRTSEILNTQSWKEAKSHWQHALDTKIFHQWEKKSPTILPITSHKLSSPNKLSLNIYSLQTDAYTHLPIIHLKTKSSKKAKVILLDDHNWPMWHSYLASIYPGYELWKDHSDPTLAAKVSSDIEEYGNIILISMRGAGLARYSGDERKQTQIRRRFYLLGQSLESLQTLDILQGLESITSFLKNPSDIQVKARGKTANQLIFAALFLDDPMSLELNSPFLDDYKIPPYINLLKYLDMEAVTMMASEKHSIKVGFEDGFEDDDRWKRLLHFVRDYPQLKLELR